MSEIKVNKIEPAAGSEVTIAAQVLGVPGTDPNHFATVSQLGGGGGAVGISRVQAQDLVDIGVAVAKQYSDEQDELQNTQIALDISAAITETKNYSHANDASTLEQANAYTDSKVFSAESDAKLIPVGGIVMTGSASGDGNGLDDGAGGTIVSNSIGPGYKVFAITYCENCGNSKLGSRYYHGERTTQNISDDTPGGYTDTPVVISGTFLCRGVAERTGVNMVSYLWQRIS